MKKAPTAMAGALCVRCGKRLLTTRQGGKLNRGDIHNLVYLRDALI